MLKVHQDIIVENLTVLVEKTNLGDLVPDLLKRNVFSEDMIERILIKSCTRKINCGISCCSFLLNLINEEAELLWQTKEWGPEKGNKQQKTDLYVEILKRGPQAFENLIDALDATNHSHLARLLRGMDSQDTTQIRRSGSLNSVGSNQYSSDNSESDGPCMSCRKMSSAGPGTVKRRESFPSNSRECVLPADMSDLSFPRQIDPRDKVFIPPAYTFEVLSESLRETEAGYVIRYTNQKNLPVNVKCAVDWQTRYSGQPGLYKMDSNPRGCALIVNNMEFDDKHKFPDRLGADNDETRMTKLLEKLHFHVEKHRNQTKRQMEEIVRKFSQKPELMDVDCIWVTFMSHGQQGSTSEDSEVAGVDGMWYKDEDIVSCFYNDSCPYMINKPKLFTFQACRGDLTDPGVLLGDATRQIFSRIHSDGRRVPSATHRRAKIRTYSDIFIAYPTPGGIIANRDYVTGTWFIQTIVDVFSEHAWNSSLDSMFKMVDAKIKQLCNLINENFQAVTTKGIGWNKDLYFNPGLYRDKTGATIRIGTPYVSPLADEGLDVVDTSSSNSGISRKGMSYGKLKEEEDQESSGNDGKDGSSCFPCKIT